MNYKLTVLLLISFISHGQDEMAKYDDLFSKYSIVEVGGLGKRNLPSVAIQKEIFSYVKSDTTVVLLDEYYYHLMSALRSDSLIFSDKIGADAIRSKNYSEEYYLFLNDVLRSYKNGEIDSFYGRANGNGFIWYLRVELPHLLNKVEIDYLKKRYHGTTPNKTLESVIITKVEEYDSFYSDIEKEYLMKDLLNLFSANRKKSISPTCDSIFDENKLIVSFEDNDWLSTYRSKDSVHSKQLYLCSYDLTLTGDLDFKQRKKKMCKKNVSLP